MGSPRSLDIAPARPENPRQRGVMSMSAGTNDNLAKTIDEAFDKRDGIGPSTKGAVREAVDAALDLLDHGTARVAEKAADGTPHGTWRVNQWLKKAVLLSFRLNDMT